MTDCQTHGTEPNASFGPALPGADVKVFKHTPQANLRLHMFYPPDHKIGDRRPAILFFFGGGWVGGSPSQFCRQAMYLASRGMVAGCAEYRVKHKHGTTPSECVADGKSAVRWLRLHAAELGVDPDRIAAGGGSAGGHVAASAATLDGFDELSEDLGTSSRPNALVLFNPVLDTTATGWQGAAQHLGGGSRDLSPAHHLGPDAPPTIILHGRADQTVPPENVERFRDGMLAIGRPCTLVLFDNMGHGFFNYGRNDNVPYTETVREMDRFLASIGYLIGEPTVQAASHT